MSQPNHTYGPTCRLARNATSPSSNDDMPHLKAQFFYSSSLPIDDPLSVVPPPSGSETKCVKHPLRPFLASDNNDLEEAWLGLASKKERKRHMKTQPPHLGKGPSEGPAPKPPIYDGTQTKRSESEHEREGPKRAAVEESRGGGTSDERQKLPEPESPPTPKDKHSRRHARAEAAREAKAAKAAAKSKATRSPSPPKESKSRLAAPDKKVSRRDSTGSKPSKSKSPKEKKVKGQKKIVVPESAGSSSQKQPDGDQDNDSSAPDCCVQMEGDEPTASSEPINDDPLVPDCSEQMEQDDSATSSNPMDEDSRSENGGLIIPMDSSAPDCCVQMEKDGSATSSKPINEDRSAPNCCEQLETDVSAATSKPLNEDSRSEEGRAGRGPAFGLSAVLGAQGDGAQEIPSIKDATTFEDISSHSGPSDPRSERKKNKSKKPNKSLSPKPSFQPLGDKENSGPEIQTSDLASLAPCQGGDTGTTGQPFLKFIGQNASIQLQSVQESALDDMKNYGYQSDSRNSDEPAMQTETLHIHGSIESTDVPVGISRLHLVKIPALQMHPIYWSPVHDIAAVTRGTWFYQGTMLPVEPRVANQLESGYRELRPWSKTWRDELNSALEVGAAGEEKIAHRLWPKEDETKRTAHDCKEAHLSTDPYCAARCFHGEAAAEGTIDLDEKPTEAKTVAKKFPSTQVIYKDSQNAFILKPTLQPSAYYGRKPLQKIKKGTTVGIHVVRGFDWKAWEKLHPSKKSNVLIKGEEDAPTGIDTDGPAKNACPACRAHEERPKVTDLILVIHGIGQKLSERVESFHFTHSINSFRRSVNIELANGGVRRVLRKEMGRIMVLPVNWRSNLSLEEGGPMNDNDKDRDHGDFSLKDITPDTIPAVRNLISDVMLDIPFYMSHHKPKMIQAVITEANRVFRLWCKNNPDFRQEGRVHIIAHSLGSAMAVEILSRQPTYVPKADMNGKRMNTKHFEFNTTNLFCAGSPAGFFLLLEKGSLVPRRGLQKPSAEQNDTQDKKVTGEAGIFGCMAVENVYNIMHYNDPIAYRLNAAADRQYAANLKNAQVPSATTGFFEGIGNRMKFITPGASSSSELGVGQLPKPGSIARLPSQLEMEIHDFTREEIAEKKFSLLNDNGQVDWFLSSGGGPLEFQYLNMLSAHSSYWLSLDFIRMIVTEVGKEAGKINCLPNMKAVKVGHKP
ncbi:hypothetical protein G7Y89_g437 [Cudoniella acicularis]|uniref:DDHD domain-containing protein n=1 Tax=Cudoniella acicularis TaxID=354080 RepID=A0A8H4RZ68_9HELO|nr:hypothetical protein G7Y89_g437 [Cudoniella acicularis]